jgi:transcription termination factor Rho
MMVDKYRSICAAMDITGSGTRKEELLAAPDRLRRRGA